MTNRESPPNAKKSSWILGRLVWRTSPQHLGSIFSSAVRGATKVRRESMPLARPRSSLGDRRVPHATYTFPNRTLSAEGFVTPQERRLLPIDKRFIPWRLDSDP
jgi:hypothetical protein